MSKRSLGVGEMSCAMFYHRMQCGQRAAGITSYANSASNPSDKLRANGKFRFYGGG